MFIFDADSYAIYMSVCRAVTQHLLQSRVVAYFCIRQAFYVKSSQNVPSISSRLKSLWFCQSDRNK